MDKKYDLSELKRMEGKNCTQRTPDDLENVSGGINLTPAQMEFAQALIQAYKGAGYTRERLIEEMMYNEIGQEYMDLYLSIWDSL